MSKLCKTFAVFCFIAGYFHFQSPLAEGGGFPSSLSRGVGTFLTEVRCPAPLRGAFLKNIEAGDLSSVAASDGAVYSLVVSPVRSDSDPDVARELETSETQLALFRARSNLALHLAKGSVNRKVYRYDDSLGQALLSYHSRRQIQGIQTAAEIVELEKSASPKQASSKQASSKQASSKQREKSADRYAAALAWLSPDAAKAFENSVPTPEALNEDYCRFLYLRHARILFQAGKYDEALPIFKHIHDLKWADIGAYLDAAECFLKVGEKEESLKLLRELFSLLMEKMSMDELVRTGRLFRAAGDRPAALRVFKTARDRFEREREIRTFPFP